MKLVLVGWLVAMMMFAKGALAAEGPIKPIADANNQFAYDLYQKLSAEKGNLFFSPYSIETALAMTMAGAKGQTAEQMAKVLHLQGGPEAIHAGFAAMIHDLNNRKAFDDKPAYELVVANALWGQKSYPFHEAYRQLVQDKYSAAMNPVDFLGDAEGARQQINKWVEQQTKDKIQELIAQGVLDRSTVLVLTNAIYFKSAWLQKFNEKATAEAPFHLAGGKTAPVKLMTQTNRLDYFENDAVQVAKLPYNGNQLTMAVILPRTVDGLGQVEKAIVSGDAAKWLEQARGRRVQVFLPKFKFTSQFGLSKTLKDMGMTDAFAAGKADFSGMASAERLFISDVIHKAFVDVHEEGTEAAAATAVIMARASIERPEEPVVFRADRPFIFAIQDRATGAILFMGRFAQPE